MVAAVSLHEPKFAAWRNKQFAVVVKANKAAFEKVINGWREQQSGRNPAGEIRTLPKFVAFCELCVLIRARWRSKIFQSRSRASNFSGVRSNAGGSAMPTFS